MQVERHWGLELMHNPARWSTPDGSMPFPLFALYARALWPSYALDRLNLVRGISLGVWGGKAAEQQFQSLIAEAHPE